MRNLLALITVGCDGRQGQAVKAVLNGETLLARAVRQLAEVSPDTVLASLPDSSLVGIARAAGVESVVRQPDQTSLEAALEAALSIGSSDVSHVLAVDPVLPMRRTGRLAEALRVSVGEAADCVFSCHRESALLWQRTEMGLVPYFDPSRHPSLTAAADSPPWLREDGGFYLLRVEAWRRCGHRHAGRLAPLEIDPAEAVAATDAAGLAVCRALLAEYQRLAATG